MRTQKLFFIGAGGEKLSALLDHPLSGRPASFALFAHCFTCTKNFKAASHICRALARQGIAVLRFDFTGLGESQGDFANTNFSSNVQDLVAASQFLETTFEAPRILIGHSLGGAAALQAAHHIPSARAVAVIGSPADPRHVGRLIGAAKENIEIDGEADIILAGRKFKIKKQFFDDLDGTRMEKTIGGLKKALLILHSPLDEIVGIDNAAHIFKTAKHPKSFISLDQADHLLTNRNDSLYAGSIIAAWARKYVDPTADNNQRRP